MDSLIIIGCLAGGRIVTDFIQPLAHADKAAGSADGLCRMILTRLQDVVGIIDHAGFISDVLCQHNGIHACICQLINIVGVAIINGKRRLGIANFVRRRNCRVIQRSMILCCLTVTDTAHAVTIQAVQIRSKAVLVLIERGHIVCRLSICAVGIPLPILVRGVLLTEIVNGIIVFVAASIVGGLVRHSIAFAIELGACHGLHLFGGSTVVHHDLHVLAEAYTGVDIIAVCIGIGEVLHIDVVVGGLCVHIPQVVVESAARVDYVGSLIQGSL